MVSKVESSPKMTVGCFSSCAGVNLSNVCNNLTDPLTVYLFSFISLVTMNYDFFFVFWVAV